MKTSETLTLNERDHKPPEDIHDWNDDIVYHVYPYTFNEERPEGDEHRGKGSILGIINKLDYIGTDLGATAIWLGPIYQSPGKDGNYDISDYKQINPDLGTLGDVENLIIEAHKRDMRVIFDLVPNHTSDQHEWFKKSCEQDSEFEDFYIWADPVPGDLPKNIVVGDRLEGLPAGLTVPNNWSSIFSLPEIEKVKQQYGGEIPADVDIPAVTAWVWHEGRQQFYLAEFMKEQPSLNWQNPKVCEEMKNVMRFWLDKGVDGFRVDVMNHIGKDPERRDEEIAPTGTAIGEYQKGVTNPHDQWKQEKLVSFWPELKKHALELLSVLDDPRYQRQGIRLIMEDWMAALANDDRLSELQPRKATVFNFERLLKTNREGWQATQHKEVLDNYYERMSRPNMRGSVPNQVTGNHDTDMVRTRLNSLMAARAAAFINLTLPGIPYIFQKEPEGSPNIIVPPERQRDGDIGLRDGERVPVTWSNSFNAGFSKAPDEKLWLPVVDPRYRDFSIADQMRDPRSTHSLYSNLIRMRKQYEELRRGRYEPLDTDHPDVLAFGRPHPTERGRVITIANFSANTVEVALRDAHQAMTYVALSAQSGYVHGIQDAIDLDRGRITLPPDEAYLLVPTT